METVQSNILTRDDTFFGVCQAIGEDFRFNPNFLRIGFALLLFWSPVAAIGGYAAAGLVVGLSRWLAPSPYVDVPVEPEMGEAAANETCGADAGTEQLAIAA